MRLAWLRTEPQLQLLVLQQPRSHPPNTSIVWSERGSLMCIVICIPSLLHQHPLASPTLSPTPPRPAASTTSGAEDSMQHRFSMHASTTLPRLASCRIIACSGWRCNPHTRFRQRALMTCCGCDCPTFELLLQSTSKRTTNICSETWNNISRDYMSWSHMRAIPTLPSMQLPPVLPRLCAAQ